jgi:hypothetical protein
MFGKQTALAQLDFFHVGTVWLHGQSCDAKDDEPRGCKEVNASTIHGLSVFEADEQEWRVYRRGGGYEGEGEGHETLVLFGDSFVDLKGGGPPSELIQRIVKTIKLR